MGSCIGIVTYVYYTPELKRYWVIDYRVFDPERDGKTKLGHVNEMQGLADKRGLVYKTALMDSLVCHDATHDPFTSGRQALCPIKDNCWVDESKGQQPYQAVETLQWSELEEQQGKVVKVKGFAKNFYLKLFRVTVSTDKTDFIVSNDVSQDDSAAAQQESSQRWKIEQFHREVKQLTGLEHCQYRLKRSQRNHICASLLVWLCLIELAHKTLQTVYQLKHGLLSDYLKQQLRQPSLKVLLI